MLCSQMIQKTKEQFPSAGVASYFYRFDERVPTPRILQSITTQLLEQLWKITKGVPDSVSTFSQTLPSMKGNILGMIRAIAESLALSRIYVFLDGVDEDFPEGPSFSQPVCQALPELTDLASIGIIRLWISSQYRTHIAKSAKPHLRLQLTNQNETALRSFFDREIPQLRRLELEPDELDQLVNVLRDKVKGNFLWARCMIGHLREVCESPEDVQEFIQRSQPWSLDEYYKDLLRRTPEHDQDLARFVFYSAQLSHTNTSEQNFVHCLLRTPSSVNRRASRCSLHDAQLSFQRTKEETSPP